MNKGADTAGHVAFLKSLDPQTRQRIKQKSDLRGLIHLGVHWGLVVAVGTLIALRVPWWPGLVPVQGILIIFSFSILHECTHQTPFRSAWLSECAGRIAGFLVGLPFLWFRYFHLAHHRHTNDPALDPELQAASKPDSTAQYLWAMSGIPVWAGQIRTLILIAAGRVQPDFTPGPAQNKMRTEATIFVSLYALIGLYSLFVSTILLSTWILPVILGQPFLRLFLLAEHGRCPMVADMFENSRTTYASRLVRFLSWNMSYHAEHHANPNVPFYRLPEFNRLAAGALKTTSAGYPAFHRSYLNAIRHRWGTG